MGHLGPLGKNLSFFVSFGIDEILGFSKISVCTEVVLLKPFPQHFEVCLYFYNLADKTFETDFNQNGRECLIRFVIYHIPSRATQTSQLCGQETRARPDLFWDLNNTFRYFRYFVCLKKKQSIMGAFFQLEVISDKSGYQKYNQR